MLHLMRAGPGGRGRTWGLASCTVVCDPVSMSNTCRCEINHCVDALRTQDKCAKG